MIVKQKTRWLFIILACTLGFVTSEYSAGAIYTQTFEMIWEVTFGGPDEDAAYSVIETSDGGFALAGSTRSFGNGDYDVWLVKTDSMGNYVWNRTYGGTAFDRALTIINTDDGGFMLFGNTESYGSGDLDIWFIKTDANGIPVWNNTYGGSNFDIFRSAIQTIDGGYVFTGGTASFGDGSEYAWLVKVDALGNHIWNKSFGASGGMNRGLSVVQASDSGLAMIGPGLYTGTSTKIGIIKTNSLGQHEWNTSLGDVPGDWYNTMIATNDEGFALAGEVTSPTDFSSDLVLIKVNKTGSHEWTKTYGSSEDEHLNVDGTLLQTVAGDFVISGKIDVSSEEDKADLWLVKTDSDGNLLRNKKFGRSEGEEVCLSIIDVDENSYVLAGYTDSIGEGLIDFWLVKVTESNVNTSNGTNAPGWPFFVGFLILSVVLFRKENYS